MKLAIAGAGGRMGRVLTEVVHATPGCTVVGGLEPPGSVLVGTPMGKTGAVISDDVAALFKTIDGLIDSLCLDFNLTDEGDVSSFLGIDMKNLPDGSYELMQPGFIDQIIHKDGLELELKEHSTPVTTKLKSKDKDSEAWEYTWNYRKGIGMLNYLSATTQKDILFATHQCACFMNKPMRVHKIAVKCIIHYLKSTCTKGYIIHPSVEKWLDCYVDADFADM